MIDINLPYAGQAYGRFLYIRFTVGSASAVIVNAIMLDISIRY